MIKADANLYDNRLHLGLPSGFKKRFKKQMINFPTICIDNFFDNPDKVREWGLSLSKQKIKREDGLVKEVNIYLK